MMRIFRHIAGWLLAIVIAAMLFQATLHPLSEPVPGEVKLFDPPGQHLVFSALARNTGISLFEPAGRFVAGLLELAVALLILVPFSRRFAAVLSCLIAATGLVLHMSPWLGREILLPDGTSDAGTHFLTSVIIFALSLLLAVTHPGPQKRLTARRMS